MKIKNIFYLPLLLVLLLPGNNLKAQNTNPVKSSPNAAIQNIIGDAAAAWHFNDGSNSFGSHPLTIHGSVKIGVVLKGSDYSTSLARGGDGKVAQFDGGYVEIGGPSFDPKMAVFTLAMRVKDPTGLWNTPLFGSYGGDSLSSLYLRGVDGASLPRTNRDYNSGKVWTPAAWMFGWPGGPREIKGSRGVIEFLWGAKEFKISAPRQRMLPKNVPPGEFVPLLEDTKNAIQRIMFPMEPVGPREWHDVIVRATGPKLELWIDGVLLDEEFPIGVTRPSTAPRYFGAAQMADGKLLTGFHGLIDHAFLWHRALDESEIIKLSGGPELVQKREKEILGAPAEKMQYYRSPGHNSKPGDCIPFFDPEQKIFHLFYLVLRRNMNSKWDGGHGALEVHHASTSDMIKWTQHPVAEPITEQWEAWNGTGAVVYSGGQYWMFFPSPDYEGDHSGIQLLTSKDCIKFNKQLPHPFIKGGDCEVFPDPDPTKKLFHMIKTGKQADKKISMAHLVSEDLKTWKELPEPFLVADENLHPSTCPNWFRMNDWYYYIGAGNIWKSRQPFGPWTLQFPCKVDALAVPKTGEFIGNRRIFAGFVIDGGYGGNLVLRDMVQFEDGNLGTRFIPEMIPATGNPIALTVVPSNSSATWNGSSVKVESKKFRNLILFDNVPNDARITLTIIPQDTVQAYGVQLRTSDGRSDGTEFRLDARKAKAIFSNSTTSGGTGGGGVSIEGLLGLDKAVKLDIVLTHDIVDVEVNRCHTLANRFWNPNGNRLGVWVEGGSIMIQDVVIRPLLEHTPPGALKPPR